VLTRRSLLAAVVAAAAAIPRRRVVAQVSVPAFSYPIGLPGRVLGDGFVIRHGYATENTWYNPGWLHTGEDWYAVEGDTAGARRLRDRRWRGGLRRLGLPGPVVIVRHAPDLFSMYGHLAYDLPVETGTAGGARSARGDGPLPYRWPGAEPPPLRDPDLSDDPEVNGEAPRYGVAAVSVSPRPRLLADRRPRAPLGPRLAEPHPRDHTPAATGMEPRVPAEVVVASGVESRYPCHPAPGLAKEPGSASVGFRRTVSPARHRHRSVAQHRDQRRGIRAVVPACVAGRRRRLG
jgi:hypothetical protein